MSLVIETWNANCNGIKIPNVNFMNWNWMNNYQREWYYETVNWLGYYGA
jgi:hypothetical protein